MSFRQPAPGTQPPYDAPEYGSTHKRHPKQPLLRIPQTLTETSAPRMRPSLYETTHNLAKGPGWEAQGERITVAGRVLDEDGRGVPNAIVELWQANAAGRYFHALDQRDAPLDPNFIGNGRVRTDAEGRYGFFTIRPGAYPVPVPETWWRPPHVHVSVLGPSSLSRLVTQMYFPGDPLNEWDRLLNAMPDPSARQRIIARQVPPVEVAGEWLGFGFDMVLRGRHATPPLP